MEKVGDEGGADFLSRLMGRGGMDFDSERCYRWEQGFDTLDIVCIIYIFFRSCCYAGMLPGWDRVTRVSAS